MLGPLMNCPRRRSLHRLALRGFTLVEALVTIAIAAILVAVAVPSFRDVLAKRRVEGIASELLTDLQYARSEAVARNASVRLTLGSGCYTVHLDSASAVSCTSASGSSVTPASALIKGVQLPGTAVISLAAVGAVTRITFEPVLGSASNDAAVDPAVLNVTSATGKAWRLQVRTSSQGRVKACSPSGAGYISGYQSDCGDS
jgi:type IV fimbrial biogenesis protein FimT